MADGKWQKRPGKAKARQDSKHLDARSVEKTERWHVAGLGQSDPQSRQYAGAPASVRSIGRERAGTIGAACPSIH
jgi:hypothetical protein